MKRFLTLVVLLLSHTLFAQDVQSGITAILAEASDYWQKDDYLRLVNLCENTLKEYGTQLNNSDRLSLLRYQYCASHCLRTQAKDYKVRETYAKISVAACLEAIRFQNSVDPLSKESVQIKRDYCNISEPTWWGFQCKSYGDSLTYYSCISDILSSSHYKYSDYDRYFTVLKWFSQGQNETTIKQMLLREEANVEKYNDYGLYPAFLYMKGKCLDRKSKQSEVIGLFEKAREQFKKKSSWPAQIAKLQISNLESLSEAYSSAFMYPAATVIYRECLDLIRQYWKELEYARPESYDSNYADLLAKTKAYKTLKQYCVNIMASYELSEHDSYDAKYYLAIAYQGLGQDKEYKKLRSEYDEYRSNCGFRKNDDKEEEIIALHKNGHPQEAIKAAKIYLESLAKDASHWNYGDDYYWYNEEILDILFNNNESTFLARTLQLFLDNADRKRLSDKQDFDYYSEFLPDNISNADLSNYEYLIVTEREYWHYDNGGDKRWLLLDYLAKAYYRLKDYDNAVKIGNRCLDNVRTDWKFHHCDERKMILERPEGHGYYTYFPAELRALFDLAIIYTKVDAHKTAELLRNAFNIIKAANNVLLLSGDEESRLENLNQYNDWNNAFKEHCIDIVLGNTISKADQSAINELSKLVFDISCYQKAILLNIERGYSELASKEKDKAIQDKKRLLNYDEYNYEEDILKGGLNREHYILMSQKARAELNDATNWSSIVSSVNLDYSTVCSYIPHGATLIDFSIYYKEGSFIFYDDRTKFVREYTVDSNCLVAIIIKPGWDSPKIIKIGSCPDVFNRSTPTNLITVDEINDFYTSDCGQKLWNKLIDAASIGPNETVYFVPTDYLNLIAFENMLNRDGTPFSILYNIKRLSSVKELQNPSYTVDASDKGVLIGGINYSNTSMNAIKAPTHDLITNISQKHPNRFTQIEGDSATREAMRTAFSSQEHKTVLISGHGYNYVYGILDKETEERFLGTLNCYQKELRSMRLTGIELSRNEFISSKLISHLDMTSKKVVFLSSCSTASGDYTLEGVYGMPRGFKMAGVKTVIAPLWNVDVTATNLLVEKFFDLLLSGQDARTALRNAQTYVRNYEDSDGSDWMQLDRKIYSSPFYWAGFVVIE